jgi:four helix bundle protein
MKKTPRAPNITERTFEFAVRIVEFCQRLDSNPGVTRTLGRQLLRSGTSIGANVEEAQAAQSSADFISKCSIALKEARETSYWLRLFTTTRLLEGDSLDFLRRESNEISRILGVIVVRTKQRRVKR